MKKTLYILYDTPRQRATGRSSWSALMDLPTKTWEYPLLARAYEAFMSPASGDLVNAESAAYEEAYDYCDRLIRANSRTFYLASSVLPWHKRRAVRALYAFCRATDDLIDQMPWPADARTQLDNWQLRLRVTPSVYD